MHIDQRTGESIFTQSAKRCKEKEKCWTERADMSSQGIHMVYWPGVWGQDDWILAKWL